MARRFDQAKLPIHLRLSQPACGKVKLREGEGILREAENQGCHRLALARRCAELECALRVSRVPVDPEADSPEPEAALLKAAKRSFMPFSPEDLRK